MESNPPQALLGYLNLAEGKPDPRFQQQVNDLYAQLASAGDERPWDGVHQSLVRHLHELHHSGAAAFRDIDQANAVLRITFDEVLPAYRRHHADLLGHLSDAELWQPFFLARVFEAVLRQRGPWDERERIVAGALQALNDFVGHRPIATLESRPEGEPYGHERVRPIPLYLRGAGVAWGRHRELIAKALEILETTDPALLREAYFDPKLLDELALDPRAYDFDHPADKRPNYVFGEWDPHCFDNQARYRRFVLRQITLDALWQRVENHGTLDRGEAVTEAAAVLAGTILMGAGVSGAGPETHDSSVTLSNLTPRIAKYRDAFYAGLLRPSAGKEQPISTSHAQRLSEEAKLTKQPFGAARQALNHYLAQQRALQLQHRRSALFFAELGDAAAARRQLAKLPVASARMLTELQLHLATGRQQVTRGQLEPAIDCLRRAEDVLHRGIDCGAFVDPWNILGFQGQHPRFQALEDSVRDHRIYSLTAAVAGIFDLYAQVLNESAALESKATRELTKSLRRLAEWWDRFATTTVSDVPQVHGAATAASAEHVARALGQWRARGNVAGDIAFWREQVDEFRTPTAFGTVIEAMLQRRDFRGASALLLTWLGQAEQIPLADADHSFHRLVLRWLLEQDASAQEAAKAIVKFFDYLEANAEDWWNVPALDLLGTGGAFPPVPKEDDGPAPDDDESLYGAAYEDMTYRDSTDDGVESEVLDVMPQKDFDLEHEAERLLKRLPFLATVARLWTLAAPNLHGKECAPALAAWLRRAQENQAALLNLLDVIHTHAVPKPTSAFDAVAEFHRRLQIKQQLVGAVLEACREHALAIGALRSAGADGAGSTVGPPWESALLALEQHLRNGERAAAHTALAAFVERFRDEPLLFKPLDQGGEPRLILRASLAQVVLASLVASLPRQGLLRDAWQLLRLARAMEASQDLRGPHMSVLIFPIQVGLRGAVEAVLAAAGREQIADEDLGAGLERIVKPFLSMWIDHTTETRMGILEAVRTDDDWRRLGEFIRRYGRDLFTRRFLTRANMSGILQRGVGAYLDDLRENADPLHPIRLIDESDTTIPRAHAEIALRLIIEALLENEDILRDYNQTCTQADFGDNLHLLLDFLGLKTEYERSAWQFRPLHLVHDVLVRRHPASAAEWRKQAAEMTGDLADEFLTELSELEQTHGMRLITVRQRLEERFVGPLEIDRLAALVEPACAQAAAEPERTEPSALEREVASLADQPSGVGLDAPPWMERLEQELRRIRLIQDPLARLAQTRSQIPIAETSFGELVKEFDGWEQTAQEG
jgi:hypothetical protein